MSAKIRLKAIIAQIAADWHEQNMKIGTARGFEYGEVEEVTKHWWKYGFLTLMKSVIAKYEVPIALAACVLGLVLGVPIGKSCN